MSADENTPERPPWPQRLAEVATILVAVGAVCVVVGAALYVIRFVRCEVPIVEGLSALPRESFLITGALNLVLPVGVYAGFAALVAWQMHRRLEVDLSRIGAEVATEMNERTAPIRAMHESTRARIAAIRAARDGQGDDSDEEHIAGALTLAEQEVDAVGRLLDAEQERSRRERDERRARTRRQERVSVVVVICVGLAFAALAPFGWTTPMLLGYWLYTAYRLGVAGMQSVTRAAATALVAGSLYALAQEADSDTGLRRAVVTTSDGALVRGGLISSTADAAWLSTGERRIVSLPARSVRRVDSSPAKRRDRSYRPAILSGLDSLGG